MKNLLLLVFFAFVAVGTSYGQGCPHAAAKAAANTAPTKTCSKSKTACAKSKTASATAATVSTATKTCCKSKAGGKSCSKSTPAKATSVSGTSTSATKACCKSKAGGKSCSKSKVASTGTSASVAPAATATPVAVHSEAREEKMAVKQ